MIVLALPKLWQEKLFRNCTDGAIENHLKETIQDLFINSRSSSFDFTKKSFGGKIVYTLNCDYQGAHRFIFQKTKLDDQHEVFLLRSIAFNHDYEKALRYTAEISDLILLEGHKITTEVTSPLIKQYTHHHGKWIRLSSEQEQIMGHYEYPLLIVGPPGSGKSVMSLTLMMEKAQRHFENGFGILRLLYVTHKKTLAKKMHQEWKLWYNNYLNLDKSNKPSTTEVFASFWSMDELVYYVSSQPDNLLFIDPDNSNLDFLPKDHNLDSTNVMREFNLASAQLHHDHKKSRQFAQSGYQFHGDRQTFFYGDKERIYDVYGKLTQSHSLTSFSPEVFDSSHDKYLFDEVYVDESQLISTQNLYLALTAARDNRVVYLADSHQRSLHMISPLTVYGAFLLREHQIQLHSVSLSQSYRLKPEISNLCTQILALDSELNHGIPDKYSYSQIESLRESKASQASKASMIDDTKLCLYWVESNAAESLTAIGKYAKAAAIVLEEEDKVLARNCIQGENVFTSNESQGLEFEETCIIISAKTLLSFVSLSVEMAQRKFPTDHVFKIRTQLSPNKEISTNSFFSKLSHLFVALSRTCGSCYFWLDTESLKPNELNKLNWLIQWLKHQCRSSLLDKTMLMFAESSLEHWLHSINSYLMNTNNQQAIGQLSKKFGLDHTQSCEYISHWHKYLVNLAIEEQVSQGLTYIERIKKVEIIAERMSDFVPEALVHNELLKQNSIVDQKSLPKAIGADEDLPALALPSASGCNKIANKTTKMHTRDALPSEVLTLLNSEPVDWVTVASIIWNSYSKNNLGYWFCEYLFKDQTSLFYNIFTNKQIATQFVLSMNLSETELKHFFKQISPYFNSSIPGLKNKSLFHAHYLMAVYLKRNEGGILAHVMSDESLPRVSWCDAFSIPDWISGCSRLFFSLTHNFYPKNVREFNADGLNRVITGYEDEEGKSPLFLLCSTTQGINYLNSFASHFKNIITKKGLEGVRKNISPLLSLSSNPVGMKFMNTHWDIFKNKLDINNFNRPVFDGLDQYGLPSMTPFLYLLRYEEGTNLLLTRWKFLISNKLIPETRLKSKDFFYELSQTQNGVELIMTYWREYFYKWIDSSYLTNAGFEVTGKEGLYSALDLLCTHAKFVDWIISHADMFVKLIPIQAWLRSNLVPESLGMMPLIALLSTKESFDFISQNWEGYFQHMMCSDIFTRMIHNGGKEPTSIMFYFCTSSAGLKFLNDHWDEFIKYINPQHFMYKGSKLSSTGFFVQNTLVDSMLHFNEGCQLVQKHKDFFDPILTAEQINKLSKYNSHTNIKSLVSANKLIKGMSFPDACNELNRSGVSVEFSAGSR